LVMDFDGTILDTEEPVYRSWAELWAEHGYELSLADWQAVIGTEGTFDPWAELETRAGRRLDPALQERRRARRDELQARHTTRPGVLDWLEEAARSGVPVGIASSSPQEWVDAHLERLGLRKFFACVVCASDVVPAKPNPTSYRLTCERLGADPLRSIAVEDSPHGVAAAMAAGLYTVAVPHPLTADLDLSAANLTVESLEMLTLSEAIAQARRGATA
jgi:HAD superfamily hydrolase (TIGR01509 family)